jgi:glycerophosphoryl diester phosphodiesterase
VNLLLDLGARLVIGHRGNAAHAPENTVESFRQALASGADAIELDVRVTRDGIAVVIHDETLERIAGRREPVARLSASELAHVDAGYTFTADGVSFPYRGRGLTIPKLADVLEEFRGVPKIIEVKAASAVEATRNAIRAAGALDELVVASSATAAVAPFRDGSFATGASMVDVARLLPRALLRGGARTLPYEAICIPRSYNGIPIPVKQLARIVRQVGVTTHVWTINDPRVAIGLWRAGVQGIISDDPGAMLSARETLHRDPLSNA